MSAAAYRSATPQVGVVANPISSLAPSGKSTVYITTSTSKHSGMRGFIAFLITFLVVLFILFLWKPALVRNADGTLNKWKLVGWSLLFAVIVAIIAALAA